MHLRLGGPARPARGGTLHYRWVLVGKPAGSRARLLDSGLAQATLIPDRPGRYFARQYVTEQPRGAAAKSGGAKTAVDNVDITVCRRRSW